MLTKDKIINQQIVTNFKSEFSSNLVTSLRGIGIECEIPVVTEQGEIVSLETIQLMFAYLEEKGFEIEYDKYSGLAATAKRINNQSNKTFDYNLDQITTESGYSTLELVLAPQDNLHTIQAQFLDLLFLLMDFFESKNCLLLGYGIHPLTAPSKKILMPKERYRFFEKLSTSHIIPRSEGGDASFLTIMASNQCHVEIDLEHAIPATNVLNALSGLQIALQANSPIWQGKIDTEYKANREALWESLYPDRLNQIGIPPTFKNIDGYVDYLFQFKPSLVKRDGRYFKILNKNTFTDFLRNESPTIGEALNGEKIEVEPEIDDIEGLLPFCYFNARLAPKYGTIESRMCCQQPPKETLTSAALTLGIIENLQAAEDLVSKFQLKTWREIRKNAVKDSFKASINGDSILPILRQFLDIAKEGLLKRNLQEEIFLQPLYKRLEEQKSPADLAIEAFNKGGIKTFLELVSFKKETYNKMPQTLDQITLTA
jgi:gamma-glutamylcysteine synthetase